MEQPGSQISIGDSLVSSKPVGSVERLKELGLNQKVYAACAPPPGDKSYKGCDLWQDCPFANPEFGGFKGTRPHYVGYALWTSGGRKEDFAPCYLIVSKLWSRFTNQNKTGELIDIVAQEGEPITRIVQLPKDPGNPKSNKMIRKKSVEKVPEFPDPADRFQEDVMALEIAEKRARTEKLKLLKRRGIDVDNLDDAVLKRIEAMLAEVDKTKGGGQK